MSRSCSHCIYYKKQLSGGGLGECRRFPPSSEMGGTWPIISKNEWCGEFDNGASLTKASANNSIETISSMIDEHLNKAEKQEDDLPHRVVYEKEKY